MNGEDREFHNVLNEESSSSSEGSYFIDINPLYTNPVQPIPDHPNDFNNWMNDAIMVEDVNIVNQEDVHAYGSSESDHAQNSSLSSLSKIKRKHRYKRYSYDEIVESLVVHYGDSKHVNEMDIIMLYIVKLV